MTEWVNVIDSLCGDKLHEVQNCIIKEIIIVFNFKNLTLCRLDY